MRRLTTPTHNFYFDIDPNEWDAFLITYKQCGSIVLERSEKDNITIEYDEEHEKYVMSFILSQEETKLFRKGYNCEVQVRCHYPDGKAYASDIIQLKIEDVLNDIILGEGDED